MYGLHSACGEEVNASCVRHEFPRLITIACYNLRNSVCQSIFITDRNFSLSGRGCRGAPTYERLVQVLASSQ